MEFLKVMIKLFIIMAMVLLMAAPLIVEYFNFKRDKKKGISYKRFRIVVFTAVYVIAVTVALYLLKELLLWLETLSFVQWIVTKLAISSRTAYFTKVLVAILVNLAIGALFVFLQSFVRIGLKKKNLVLPKKKDGTFNLRQRTARKVIRFFHTETWFFVAQILKWFNLLISALYGVVFTLYQVPAVFAADWIPYDFISMLFSAGYLYPIITLLMLWESYFFLEGIRRLEEECPELLAEAGTEIKKTLPDIKAIDAECQKCFKDYYACSVEEGLTEDSVSASDHSEISRYIGQAVENDKRNPQASKEVYLNCLDQMVESKNSILINGGFFTEFSMYFLRYLSVMIAQGDNVVLVCNNDEQIDEVYSYVREGLSEITSLYSKGFRTDAIDFDDPIWRIVKISGEHDSVDEAAIDDNSILVTTLNYLCSAEFERDHGAFIHLLDTVVFVDTINTINAYSRQLSILNMRLQHITKNNSLLAKNSSVNEAFRVRYMSRQVRYVCFDDTRTPGIDKVLKNMLSVEFDSVDAMIYHPQTLIRCYNFEGKYNEEGKVELPQFIDSEEEIGTIMNMAILCLAKGASNVTIFADDAVPYANIAETIAANSGQIILSADENHLRLNKPFYNPDEYSVVIAVDSKNNLPAAIRKYASMTADKPALVIVFSAPYLLRDYYVANIDSLWIRNQISRIPVEDGTKKDIAQKILVKANAGGISEEEIFRLAINVPQLQEFVEKKNINGILRAILEVYGIQQEDRIDLFKHFEYSSSKDFDENGNYNPENKVLLRQRGQLFDIINGRDMAVMVVGDREITLPIPKGRLTQNHIAGQNLLHNGNIYYIQKIDTNEGKIYARLAVGGKNTEAYRYIQARKYLLDRSEIEVGQGYPTKHVVLNREEGGVKVTDAYVSVFRAPAEVVTTGYYAVDPYSLDPNSKDAEYYSISDPGNDLLAKQTYRRYGILKNPTYSSDNIMKNADPVVRNKGVLAMSVKLSGQFGQDCGRTAVLAAVMLNEIIHSMFASVADAVVVCPVLPESFFTDETLEVLRRQPQISVIDNANHTSSGDLELLIVEDSDADLGVVSVLMSAGDDILNTLFGPILSYLNWYLDKDNTASEAKSTYLQFGLDHEPECFDFDSLHKLSKILGDEKHKLKFVDIESVIEYETCDFCGRRYVKGDKVIELDDGRRMCKECAENLVGNNRKVLRSYLERARIFLESTYGITLDNDYEFCFESTVKIANTLKQHRELLKRSSDIPLKGYIDEKKKVHVEYSIPAVSLSELIVRELTYVWQINHVPELSEELAEGHIALVAVQYLRFLSQNTVADLRTNYYESTSNPSGVGYRKLVRELLANPQFSNNPFRYLLEASGQVSEDVIVEPVPRIAEDGDYGLPYTPEKPDRCGPGMLPYFYFSRLEASKQRAYETILAAIERHEATVQVSGITFEEACRVVDAIRYDRPELFYFKTFSMRGNEIFLSYGASAEEAEALKRRIDEVVPRYLAGIDDSMSAYDVALRMHVKIINTVDYDTIALNRQQAAGGPAGDKIDYLRTICGVFLDGKAVCEGYARAMQYLLQKCGIECAECAGYIKKSSDQDGGAHAWNILKADGDYYYLDTTWDDQSSTIQTVKMTDLGFDYFCITSDELERTRDTKLCPVEMPDCTATRCNYYYHNDFVLEHYDMAKIKTIAQTAARAGDKSFTVKCKTRKVYDETFEQLCVNGQDCYEVIKSVVKTDKRILSNTYSYSYDKDVWTITVKFKYK